MIGSEQEAADCISSGAPAEVSTAACEGEAVEGDWEGWGGSAGSGADVTVVGAGGSRPRRVEWGAVDGRGGRGEGGRLAAGRGFPRDDARLLPVPTAFDAPRSLFLDRGDGGRETDDWRALKAIRSGGPIGGVGRGDECRGDDFGVRLGGEVLPGVRLGGEALPGGVRRPTGVTGAPGLRLDGFGAADTDDTAIKGKGWTKGAPLLLPSTTGSSSGETDPGAPPWSE